MSQNHILRSQIRAEPYGQKRHLQSGKQAAREILVLCTTATISPGRKERITQILSGTVDWQYLVEIAEFHNVAPMVSHNLINLGFSNLVSQPCLERLRHIYRNTLFCNVVISDELKKVLAAFSQRGIATIALKGVILAEQLYANPGLRHVGDMDILVKPEELSLARSILTELGYRQMAPKHLWDHPFHEVPYYKPVQFPFFIELHWNLDDPKLVTIPNQIIWQRARILPEQDKTTLVLSPEDTLLFLSNNLTKQDYQLLRSLADITETLKKYNDVLDWDYIIASARSWEIAYSVYYSLRWAQALLEAPVPVSLLEALKPGVWRRCLLAYLVSMDFLISATKLTKLRGETCNIVRSLMMKHPSQMLKVLAGRRISGKGTRLLKSIIWMVFVFGAALPRNIISGLRWIFSTNWS